MNEKEEKFISNELNKHKKHLKTKKNSKIRGFLLFYLVIKNIENTEDKDSSDDTLQQGMPIENNSNLSNCSPITFKPVAVISSIGHDFFKIEDEQDASRCENLG